MTTTNDSAGAEGESSAHDRPIGLASAEVTDEMRRRGADYVDAHCARPCAASWPAELAELIYRAMHAVAPVPLVSDGKVIATLRSELADAYRTMEYLDDRRSFRNQHRSARHDHLS